MKAIEILRNISLSDKLPGDAYVLTGAYINREMQVHFASAWYRGKNLETESTYLVVDVERFCEYLKAIYGDFIAEYGFDDEHFIIFEIDKD